MARLSEIERLEDRRRALVAESQRLRQEITAEIENLRPTATAIERGYLVGRSIWSVWPLFGSLAGLFLLRKPRPSSSTSWLRKIGKVWSLWRLGKKVTLLWRTFSTRKAAPPEDEPTSGSV